MAVPDVLRGRLSAFKAALSGGGPHLGDAESGAVAALTTPAISVVSGGLLSIIGAVLVGVWGRDLWDQSTDDAVMDDATAGPPRESAAPDEAAGDDEHSAVAYAAAGMTGQRPWVESSDG
jgi:hypothetical protein